MEMAVDTVEGLSGHSDRNELIRFIYKLASKPERIIINHGDSHKCSELARDVHKMFRCETLAPRNLEVVRIK